MAASDVCPTEDFIKALLELLVDPILPAKSSLKGTPSQLQQELVAKQMHAVVLLFNYYHRKQYPQLKYEDFPSFCKLLVMQKPALTVHMQFMARSDDIQLDDAEQLSLTENAIMEACDISKSLDASRDIPSTEGWPISKIAVFLVDLSKESCYLKFGSITQGVWSVIEKDKDISSNLAEGTMEGKHKSKKIKITRKQGKEEYSADESGCRELAFSAVKEATGIDRDDLMIMRKDVVYSLSKEKTVAWFYVIQCTLPKKDDIFQISTKHVIDSLQGPLVTRSAGQWITTQVVEYFHLLPYAGILSAWIYSNVPCKSIEDHKLQLATSSSKVAEKPFKQEVPNNQDHSHINRSIGNYLGTDAARSTISAKHQAEKEHYIHGSSGAYEGPDNLKVAACSVVPSEGKLCNKVDAKVQLGSHQRKSPTLKVDQKDIADVKVMSCITKFRGENKQAVCDTLASKEDEIPTVDHSVVNCQPNFKDLDKLGKTIVSLEPMLSQTALRVLHTERLKLTLQQRNIQDQIALCDKKIQTVWNGGEDDLEVKIKTVIEGCSDVSVRNITEEHTPHVEDQCSTLSIKSKQLSEVVFKKLNSCQELDGICHDNNWILPAYSVSPLDGGFIANVTVKGVDFDTSCDGDVRPNPREARESAAILMLANLRSMASRAQ